jgi:DNA-binding cell septation regulator SpoVG
MKIINMRLNKGQSKLRAFFDLEIDGGIVIKGFKIAEGSNGVFVAMPSEKDKDGKWWDRVTMPADLKEELTSVALGHYEALQAGQPESQEHPTSYPQPPATLPEADLPF